MIQTSPLTCRQRCQGTECTRGLRKVGLANNNSIFSLFRILSLILSCLSCLSINPGVDKVTEVEEGPPRVNADNIAKMLRCGLLYPDQGIKAPFSVRGIGHVNRDIQNR